MKRSFFLKEGIRQWYLPPTVTLAKFVEAFFSLVPFRPAAANIMVTHNCNSRCIMCSFWKNSSSGELTTDEVGDVLDQLRGIGSRRVCFSGGEPTLREDLPLLIRQARGLRFENVQIITNGLLLSEPRGRQLLDSGLDRVSISIDGVGEDHDRQRGVKGGYQQARQALELMIELRNREYPWLEVEVGTTVTRMTMESLPELLGICGELNVGCTLQILENSSFWSRDLNISRLSVNEPESIDRMVDRLHGMIRIDSYPISIIVGHLALEFIRRYLQGEVRPRALPGVPCTAGLTAIYVDAQGKVYPGCWAMPAAGDLRRQRLDEVVHSPEYRDRVRRMFRLECPKCPNGYIWSMWYYLPALFREALLRTGFVLKGHKQGQP